MPIRDPDGLPRRSQPAPPISYTDGVVTLRPLRADDADAHVAGIDDEQITWLWLPGQRQQWAAMSSSQKRHHVRRWIGETAATFGEGPSWTFAADLAEAAYAGYVECDLANDHVPAGEANLSYVTHPGHRRRGVASRAVRLAVRFLAEHTGVTEAHLVVDAENAASLRVASSLGAPEVERWDTVRGRTMVRHVLPVLR